jgi:hypothetical protein
LSATSWVKLYKVADRTRYFDVLSHAQLLLWVGVRGLPDDLTCGVDTLCVSCCVYIQHVKLGLLALLIGDIERLSEVLKYVKKRREYFHSKVGLCLRLKT